jgi:hypothetical protein
VEGMDRTSIKIPIKIKETATKNPKKTPIPINKHNKLKIIHLKSINR